MEALNKLYSSVTNTVSQLSSVLPGNPVTREFEATQLIATAGPGLLWKVYKGYKKSTKQEASIFVFEKKSLEKWNKSDREIMLESLKRGIVQLTKLRHPLILTVQHGLEESRESLAFATEPVFSSLANILGNTENLPQPLPTVLVNYKLYELEIKYGLMQIAEGLVFLHNDVKLLHHNVCPESIIVNQQGAWKIFGFDFCIANQNSSGAAPLWPFSEYCPAMHVLTQPPLDYLAPDYVISKSQSTASDIYSLGMLIYTLHSPGNQPLGKVGNDYGKYKKFANDISNLPISRLSCVADGLRDYVKQMLNVSLNSRPVLHHFLKIPYFEDIGVKTLNYLDSMFQWDNLEKSKFYKGLPEVIQNIPHRVCIYRIVACLAKEFVNPPMIPFVLPNILLIAEKSSKEEYVKCILPIIKPAMLIQDPIQILFIFMQNMELLLKLTPPEAVKADILPMLYRALDSDGKHMQELCLSVLPTYAFLIEYSALKNALLPRIKKLCLETDSTSVKVNCLLCLGNLLDYMDKWLVIDEIIPFLPQIPPKDPAVLMAILGVYKLIMNNDKLYLSNEVIARKVLPFIIPMTVERGLKMNQFNSIMSLVKQLISQVETQHRIKLTQMNDMQNETSKIMEPSTTTSDFVTAASNSLDNFSLLSLDSSATEQRVSSGALPPENLQKSIFANDFNSPTRLLKTNEHEDRVPPLQTATPKSHYQSTEPLGSISQPKLVYEHYSNRFPVGKPSVDSPISSQSNYQSLTSLNSLSLSQRGTSQSQNTGLNQNVLSSFAPNWSNDSNKSTISNKWTATPNVNKQDWSAFESLLPNQDNKTQSSTKKLKDGEMMDLLD